MKTKRLTETERNYDGSGISKQSLWDEKKHCPSDFAGEVLAKLADYEDMEDLGMLCKLPCKRGDKVFYLRHVNGEKDIYEAEVETFLITDCISANVSFEVDNKILVRTACFGENLFLTYDKAKGALKKQLKRHLEKLSDLI